MTSYAHTRGELIALSAIAIGSATIEHQATILRYAEAMRAGKLFLPILVRRNMPGGFYPWVLVDGTHRAHAARRCGYSHVPAIVAVTPTPQIIRPAPAMPVES